MLRREIRRNFRSTWTRFKISDNLLDMTMILHCSRLNQFLTELRAYLQ